jgi:hypothetical protein
MRESKRRKEVRGRKGTWRQEGQRMKEWKGIGQNSKRKERNEELTVKGVNMERGDLRKGKGIREKRGRH